LITVLGGYRFAIISPTGKSVTGMARNEKKPPRNFEVPACGVFTGEGFKIVGYIRERAKTVPSKRILGEIMRNC
jgi:hypothetical protein